MNCKQSRRPTSLALQIHESWETANSQHPVTSNYVALCLRSPLRSRSRCDEGKKTQRKEERRQKEKKGTRSRRAPVLEGCTMKRGCLLFLTQLVSARVCGTGSQLTFHVPLNKGFDTPCDTCQSHSNLANHPATGFQRQKGPRERANSRV